MTIVTLANGCRMAVYYRTRLACGIWQDVLIDEIRTFDYFSPCWPQSINWNPASVVSEVTQLLLLQNPMNFEPNQIGEPCASNWRVTVGGCWRASSSPWDPGPPHIMEHTWFFPCTPTVCCLSLYRVCIDTAGNRTFTRLPSDPSQPTCASMPNGDECVPVCDGFN
jgi:hypothetical protein